MKYSNIILYQVRIFKVKIVKINVISTMKRLKRISSLILIISIKIL